MTNARLLTTVSPEVNRLEALTPNRLLNGQLNVCKPNLIDSESFIDDRKVFRQTQEYADLILNRLRKFYFPFLNMHQRRKNANFIPFKVGDMI